MQRAQFVLDGGLHIEAIICTTAFWPALPEASDPAWHPVWLEYVVLALRVYP